MHTFCKLKDGREMVVWSDNTDEQTMNVYPVKYVNHFNVEVHTTILVTYDQIACIDTNPVVAFGKFI